MRSFAAILVSFLALTGVAAAAGGPAIPAGAYRGGGVTGPSGTAASEFRYVAASGRARETTVAKINTDGGHVSRFAFVHGSWALPAVTLSGQAGGLSADGETLVLIRPHYGYRPRHTRLRILGTKSLRTVDEIRLDGSFSFDAISPDGGSLYLVQYPDPRDPLDYRLRRYDLAAGSFRGGPIVDPDEPGEKMTGQPMARRASPDGAWAYTLYTGGDETFIHALNTELAQAQCVDLASIDPADAFRLGLRVDGATGEITVLDKDEPVATVDPTTFKVNTVAPAADAAPPRAEDGAGADWIAPTAIGAGIALLAAACVLVLRRRRRATA